MQGLSSFVSVFGGSLPTVLISMNWNRVWESNRKHRRGNTLNYIIVVLQCCIDIILLHLQHVYVVCTCNTLCLLFSEMMKTNGCQATTDSLTEGPWGQNLAVGPHWPLTLQFEVEPIRQGSKVIVSVRHLSIQFILCFYRNILKLYNDHKVSLFQL